MIGSRESLMLADKLSYEQGQINLDQIIIMLHFGCSKSELAKENRMQFAMDPTRDLSEYSIDCQRHDGNRRNLQEIQSQNIERHEQSKNNKQFKRQLVKLMTLVKLENFGYDIKAVGTLVDDQLSKLHHLQQISSRQLDDEAAELADIIISQLLGENGARRLERENSLMERLMRMEENQHELSIQSRHDIENMVERPINYHPTQEILCSICYMVTNHYCQQLCLHNFCEDCMKGYIRENIVTGNYIIKCPEYDCKQFVSMENIKYLLQPKQFERFKYFKEKNEKEMNPNNKFCHRPDCGQLLIKIEDRLVCDKCQAIYCEICLQPFHEGSSCDIVLKNALENTFKIFKIKKCPNCKSPIEKSQGCNHMNCKKCKFQFCWLCLKQYSRHHYRYYNCFGCPGMQFQDESEMMVQRVKQLSLYLLLPFIISLILLCYVVAIPVFMVGCLIYKPCTWVNKGSEMIEGSIVHNCCCCFPDCFMNIIIWFLLQPRAILYATFVAPIKITSMFWGEICRIFD